MTIPRPPRFAEWLADRVLAADTREAFLGDLAEAFARRAQEAGGTAARRWYWREVLAAPIASAPRRAPRPRRTVEMSSILADIRLTLRGVARRPGFTAICVLTTAIGVGATTAILSAAYPILFAPLPYPGSGQIVAVDQVHEGTPDGRIGFMTIADIRDRNRTLERIAAIGSWQATVSGTGEPTQYKGLRVSPEYLDVLGVRPAIGRNFRPEEDVPNAARSAIIAHSVWRERFNGDSSVIGRVVSINDYPYTIVGVMAPDFEDVLEPEAKLWRPLQYTRTTNSSCRSCQHLRAIARVKPGPSVPTAAADVDAIVASLGREFPADYPQHVRGVARDLGGVVTASVKPAMIAILAAVSLVLLMAAVNATNLLLGRAAERRAELAVRTALGAARGRLVRQLLIESLILTGAGGALGVVLAWSGLGSLVRLAPSMLPRLAAVQVNTPVLVAALALTTLIGVGVGLLPALEATRGSVSDGMQGASRRTVGRVRGVRGALVVAEMTLAVLVLVGSGLLLRSMTRLLDVRPGFDPAGVLSLQLNLVGQKYNDNAFTWQYYDQVLTAVRSAPGVEAAAFTSQLPLSDDFDMYGVHSERHPARNPSDDPSAHRYGVTTGYLELMRIPVVRGRSLTEADVRGDSVVLINAAFAARIFSGKDPIGERVRIGAHDQGAWRTIVGITGDVRQVSLSGEVPNAIYLPERQNRFADSPISLVVRTSRDPASIAGGLRKAVWSVDPTQPILRLSPLRAIVESSAAQRRFVLTLFEVFAALAAVLAALGMYGVLAASVGERVREIGVREALGATPREIVAMVVRQGLRLATAGAVLGGVLSAGASRLIRDQLFATSRADVGTYAGVLGLLAVIALVACAVPAARAARVDPMESLRAE